MDHHGDGQDKTPGPVAGDRSLDGGRLGHRLCQSLQSGGFRVSSPIWHPFTQHALTPEATLVARGEGAWLETEKGRLLDAISSWWVITHGHRHPKIMAA